MTEHLKISARGQGPELVLLHGWAMHSGIWGRAVDALAADYRVNLVDLPGHGLNRDISLPRELETVAEMILSAVPPAAWVGWSLGGLVSLAAARLQPERVRRLVMVGATPSFSRQEDWEWGVGTAARQAFTNGLENAYEETVGHFALQTFGADHLQESLVRLGDLPMSELMPAEATLRNGLHLLYNNNLLPGLEACDTPTLFLGGSDDRTIRPQSFVESASRMPVAKAVSIAGAGHVPFISHEEEFLRITRAFLNEDGFA